MKNIQHKTCFYFKSFWIFCKIEMIHFYFFSPFYFKTVIFFYSKIETLSNYSANKLRYFKKLWKFWNIIIWTVYFTLLFKFEIWFWLFYLLMSEKFYMHTIYFRHLHLHPFPQPLSGLFLKNIWTISASILICKHWNLFRFMPILIYSPLMYPLNCISSYYFSLGNSLSPISTSHMYMSIWQSTGACVIFQMAQPWKKQKKSPSPCSHQLPWTMSSLSKDPVMFSRHNFSTVISNLQIL